MKLPKIELGDKGLNIVSNILTFGGLGITLAGKIVDNTIADRKLEQKVIETIASLSNKKK